MLKLRFEGITATVRDEFITVRLYAIPENHRPMNCGLLVMYHADFATLALWAPQHAMVQVECVMTEGTIQDYLERMLGQTITAA